MANHKISDLSIERLSGTYFAAKWSYSPSMGDKDKHKIGYQFHCGGGDIGNPNNNHGSYWDKPQGAGNEKVCDGLTNTKVGYDNDRWDVVNVYKFWPHTRVQLTEVKFAIYIKGQSTSAYTNVNWAFLPPISPTIKLTRNANSVTAEIDPRNGSMNYDSTQKVDRWRASTFVWVQKLVGEQDVRPIVPFTKPGGYTDVKTEDTFTFANYGGRPPSTSSKDGLQNHFDAGTQMSVSEIGANPPVMIRVIAANEGPSGESSIAEDYHVFSIPNRATCVPVFNGDRVNVRTSYNYSLWHPTDGLELQRQTSPKLDMTSSGRWESITTLNYDTSQSAAGLVTTLTDGGRGSFEPPEDNATWYRVRTWHDEASNQNFGYASLPALVANPCAPTVEGEFSGGNQSVVFGTIKATITVNSKMDVKTEIKVISGTKDITGWSVLKSGKTVDGQDTKYTTEIIITPDMVGGQMPGTAKYQIVARNVVQKSTYGDVDRSALSRSDEIYSSERAELLGYTLSTPIIDYVTPNADGESLTVGWHWEESDTIAGAESQGTEIAWTSRPWASTTEPQTYQVRDGALRSGEIIIDGLTEGVEYNIEVKRYVTIDNDTGYSLPDRAPDPSRGLYTTPWSTPEKPYMRAPRSVAVGNGITYRWTFVDTNDTPQTDAILTIGIKGTDTKSGEVIIENPRNIPIEGSQGSYVYQTSEDDIGTIAAAVSVRTGGGWSERSEIVETIVAHRPTCTIEEAGELKDGVLSASPLSVTLGGTGDVYSVVVTCLSGAALVRPDGYHRTSVDQVVASLTCAAGTIEIPCSLAKGGRYAVTATCTDSITGLVSDEAVRSFVVDWKTAPTQPTGSVDIIDGQAYITGSGKDGETFNIWRNTSDGAILCQEDAVWSTETERTVYVDTIPPYSWDECSYILEAISVDGDSTWTEIPYTYKQSGIMIDWDGGHLEAPWNLDISSRYEREFERNVHLDGTTSGNWGATTLASASITVQSMRDDDDLVVLLKQLARSNGICAVRATHGFLMFGDVKVEMRRSYQEGYLNISIEVTGIDDDGTFDLKSGDES